MIANAPHLERSRPDSGHGTPPAPRGRTGRHALAEFVPDESAILWIGEIADEAIRTLEARGCRVQTLPSADEEDSTTRSAADLGRLDFGRTRFDAVVVADTLGRVSRPDSLLSAVRMSLKINGRLLVLVPNAAHPAVVRAVARGESPYGEDGPIDRGQLRLFSATSLADALEGADFAIGELGGIPDPGGQDVAAWLAVAFPLPIAGLGRLQGQFRECALARVEAERTAEILRSMLAKTRQALDASHLRADALASRSRESHAAGLELQKAMSDRDREYETTVGDLLARIDEIEPLRRERDAAHRHALAAEARCRALELRVEHVLMEIPRRVARKLRAALTGRRQPSHPAPTR